MCVSGRICFSTASGVYKDDKSCYGGICDGYHIPYIFVSERELLKNAVHKMLSTEGPFVLECAVKEEDNVMPMVPPGCSVNEMLLEVNR